MAKPTKNTELKSVTDTEQLTDNEVTENSEVTPEVKAEPKVIDLNKPNIQEAIAIGKEMTNKGEVTKAEVARKMFELIKNETREVIVQSFIQGANLTPAGAQTYYYNVKRKAGKS
jgi:hypothetical protein